MVGGVRKGEFRGKRWERDACVCVYTFDATCRNRWKKKTMVIDRFYESKAQ
jgi:hypothetical protein